jgi:hypothetical protein
MPAATWTLPSLDARALQAGSRDLGALADRCRALWSQLRRGGDALRAGPGSWSGVAARAGGERAGRLLAALDQAAAATGEAAGVLAAAAVSVEGAQATLAIAERLAASAGAAPTPPRLAPPGGIASAAGLEDARAGRAAPGGLEGGGAARLVQALAGEADDQLRAGTAAAAAAFDALTGRAAALCEAIDRRGAFIRAVEARTSGPVSPWADVRDGLLSGLAGLAEGAVQAGLLASPLAWALDPSGAERRNRALLTGGAAALRDPVAAVREQLGTDDLENGHAWRFWARLVPQAVMVAAFKGAGDLARAAEVGERPALAVSEAAGRLGAGGVAAGRVEGQLLPRGSAPLGFGDPVEFERFGAHLGAGLRKAGYADVRAAFQGSSVTGRNYLSGAPFDAGHRSDFDVALGGPSLFERARSIGVDLRSGGTRTAPLSKAQLEALGLKALGEELARASGRSIRFMLYRSIDAAAVRRPSIMVPLR